MAPDKYKIRIQNLFQTQATSPRSTKHPHTHVRKRKQNASQYLFRKIARIPKELLLMLTSTRDKTSAHKQDLARSPPTSVMAPCFELPKLTPINFSLTEGTDIPSPPESPKEETPSISEPTHVVTKAEDTPPHTNHTSNDFSSSRRPSNDDTSADLVRDEKKRDVEVESPYEPVPLSPVFVKQPSSIRKFLSRRSLHANFNSDSCLSLNLPRPDSAMSYVSGNTTLSNGKKKAFGWFSRLSGSHIRKRTSIVIEEKTLIELPPSPPPPMLPKLNQLRAKVSQDGDGLGGADLFKDIN